MGAVTTLILTLPEQRTMNDRIGESGTRNAPVLPEIALGRVGEIEGLRAALGLLLDSAAINMLWNLPRLRGEPGPEWAR
jgi:hypothetical protein